VVNARPWPLHTQEKHPVPIIWEAGWAPGPVRTGAETLAHAGIRSPDRPVRSDRTLMFMSAAASNSSLIRIFRETRQAITAKGHQSANDHKLLKKLSMTLLYAGSLYSVVLCGVGL
jgi:hypothetical protein